MEGDFSSRSRSISSTKCLSTSKSPRPLAPDSNEDAWRPLVECHLSRDEYQDRDEEDAYLVILSAAVLTAIREGLTPKDDYMKPENIFYSLENHHKLRCAARQTRSSCPCIRRLLTFLALCLLDMGFAAKQSPPQAAASGSG